MKTIKLVLTIAMLACCLRAQVKLEADPATTPAFTQAKLETRAAPDLAAAVEAASKQPGQPLWVGYAEPLINRPRFICCFDTVEQFRSMKGCCSGCKLEGRQGSYFDSNSGTCVNRTPPTHFFVLIRIADGDIRRIRTFTPHCGLDAGGIAV